MDDRAKPLVLIVDDEPPVARLIAYALRNEGCDVVHARTLAEARQHLVDAVPTLVVCDIRLAGESGVEFTNEIKSRPDLGDVPVVLMSVYERPRGTLADAFIAKPFDITTFLYSVRPYLTTGAA
ncbi:MAG: response regulator [Tepidiformaceae bacterium]